MARTHRFHLDLAGHSVTVQTRHATRETELLVDGKVVDYQRTQTGHRKPAIALTAELPGDPPQPFDVTVQTGETAGRAATCVLEIAGRKHPMPEMPLGRTDTDLSGAPRPSLRSMRRLLRSLLRRTRRR
ncbi:hypothetical protein WJ438_37840 [Streptomyces sp. GD-15H]|uniref:hypothetical protein n=1 Tax=Streptomyces sp. GD-15H TaxID=3129112 RepID=UPI0032433635